MGSHLRACVSLQVGLFSDTHIFKCTGGPAVDTLRAIVSFYEGLLLYLCEESVVNKFTLIFLLGLLVIHNLEIVPVEMFCSF